MLPLLVRDDMSEISDKGIGQRKKKALLGTKEAQTNQTNIFIEKEREQDRLTPKTLHF